MSWKSIKKFFRDNPRMWIVMIGAALILLGVVWVIYGGFDIGVNRFFAGGAPLGSACTQNSDCLSNSCTLPKGLPLGTCGDGSVSATTVPTAVAAAAPTPLVNPSASTVSCGLLGGTVCDSRNAGGCRSGYVTVGQKTTDCDSGYGYCCKSSVSGDAPPAGASPAGRTDPTGNCVYRTDAGAPNGGWYCRGLSCPLNGPNDGSAPQPAVSAVTKYFHGTCNGVTVNDARVGCAGVWDMTPKAANGQEGYPPRDPAWTCTGPITLGLSSCYNPRGNFSAAGVVTCQANSGLSGDSASVTVTGGTAVSPTDIPITPTPSVSPVFSTTTSPTTSAAPVDAVQCAPVSQSIAPGQTARLSASGGDGTYTWDITGGGILEEGGNQTIGVSYVVESTKTLRVVSAGTSASCVIYVSSATVSSLSVQKSAHITTTDNTPDSPDSTSVSVFADQTIQFTIRITNTGTRTVTGLMVKDTVPSGMTYVSASTRVGGVIILSNNPVSGSGLPLGDLLPGATTEVQWSALADRASQISPGPNLSRPGVQVTATGISAVLADMTVTVYGTGADGFADGGPGINGTGGTGTAGSVGGTGVADGTGAVGGAGGIPTGPGDAVTIALVMAVLLTLLYSGYTRSAAFRRHEAESVSRDQGPLDFRS